MIPTTIICIDNANYIIGSFDISDTSDWWKSHPFPDYNGKQVVDIKSSIMSYADTHVAIVEMSDGSYSIYHSNDNGFNWVCRLNLAGKIYQTKMVDYGWIVLSSDNGWYKSTSCGRRWTKITTTGDYPKDCTLVKVGFDIFVAHDGDYIWRSTDYAETWIKVYTIHDTKMPDDDAGWPKLDAKVLCYPAIDGTYAKMYASCGGFLLESVDGGEHWASFHGWNSWYGVEWEWAFPQGIFQALRKGTATIVQIIVSSVDGPGENDVQFLVKVFFSDTNTYRIFCTIPGYGPPDYTYYGNYWFRALADSDFVPTELLGKNTIATYDVMEAGTNYFDRVIVDYEPYTDLETGQQRKRILYIKDIKYLGEPNAMTSGMERMVSEMCAAHGYTYTKNYIKDGGIIEFIINTYKLVTFYDEQMPPRSHTYIATVTFKFDFWYKVNGLRILTNLPVIPKYHTRVHYGIPFEIGREVYIKTNFPGFEELIEDLELYITDDQNYFEITYDTLDITDVNLYNGDPSEHRIYGPLLEENYMKHVWTYGKCLNSGNWSETELFARRCISWEMGLTLRDYMESRLSMRMKLIKINEESYSIGTLLIMHSHLPIELDALVQKTIDVPYQVGMPLSVVLSTGALFDCSIRNTFEKSASFDAIFARLIEVPLRMDALIQNTEDAPYEMGIYVVDTHYLDLVDRIDYIIAQMWNFTGSTRARTGVFNSTNETLEGYK
jgi:hypothetical protein